MPRNDSGIKAMKRQRRRTVFYVLLTRCAHCTQLTEVRKEPFKPKGSGVDYCVGIARHDIVHPATGLVTHKRGQAILITEGTMLTVFGCPKNEELKFVSHLSFASACPDFARKVVHHRCQTEKKLSASVKKSNCEGDVLWLKKCSHL